MGKKTQNQNSQQNDTFDLSQVLGDDEIETAGEEADFGDEVGSAQLTDEDKEPVDQFGGESFDDIGHPEKDLDGQEQDDSQEDETGDEGEDAGEADDETASETEEDESQTGDESESESQETEPEPEDDRSKQTGKQKDPVIPKRRLDSEIAKRRQVEQELKQLRQQQQETQKQLKEREKVPEEDIQKWLQDSAQKALDGATEESAQLQQKAFDAMARNRGEGESSQQEVPDPEELVQQVEERVELKHKVKDVFEAYPALDPNSESFDETLNEEVVELNDFYTQKGYTGSAAVERAVEVLAAQHGLKPANAEPEPESKPKKPERNTKPDVEKKMDVAKKQPSEPSNRRGNRQSPEETVDVSNLDDEELMALPENVRARLRGDM